MLAMEEYQELLKMALKLEKLNMIDSAEDMYKKYIKGVSNFNTFDDILILFYGSTIYDDMKIKGIDETINKAIIAEYLKKLYMKLDCYRINWNGEADVPESHNKILMDFLRWASKDKTINTRDIEIIKPFLKLIEDGCGFDISTSGGQEPLLQVIQGVLNRQIYVDSYRNEIR